MVEGGQDRLDGTGTFRGTFDVANAEIEPGAERGAFRLDDGDPLIRAGIGADQGYEVFQHRAVQRVPFPRSG
jgi:hypothetical protein